MIKACGIPNTIKRCKNRPVSGSWNFEIHFEASRSMGFHCHSLQHPKCFDCCSRVWATERCASWSLWGSEWAIRGNIFFAARKSFPGVYKKKVIPSRQALYCATNPLGIALVTYRIPLPDICASIPYELIKFFDFNLISRCSRNID